MYVTMIPCLLVCAGILVAGEAVPDFDRYGGLAPARFAPGPFFRVEKEDGVWWLVTPDGGAFFSIGVTCVRPEGSAIRDTGLRPYRDNILARHGSIEAWADAVAGRFQEWGVNTVGAWSGPVMRDRVPYTVSLGLAHDPWNKGVVPDLFSPDFERLINDRAVGSVVHAGDPMLIGYFLDNELPWGPDHRRTQNLFAEYMKMSADSPGKAALVQFLRERHGDMNALRRIWKTSATDWDTLAHETRLGQRDKTRAQEDRDGFTLLAARRYFAVTTGAVRAIDPDHLILGSRFIWQTVPKPVVQACGEYCDVISVNFYETGILGKPILWYLGGHTTRMPSADTVFQAHSELTGKPVMITEFSFRSKDSGLPNTFPPSLLVQPLVATQSDRAEKYRHYTSQWAASAHIVGYHWFQYMDQPKEGRFDGENGNYGLVNIEDEPYGDFVESLTRANQDAWRFHKDAR